MTPAAKAVGEEGKRIKGTEETQRGDIKGPMERKEKRFQLVGF